MYFEMEKRLLYAVTVITVLGILYYSIPLNDYKSDDDDI